MKKLILFVHCFLLVSISVQAQQSELQLVEQTLNYYLEGGTNNDFETLKKAFHSTATMRYIADDYQEVNAIEFFGKIMKPGPKQNRKTRIVAMSVAGHAANARLEIEYPTFTFIDFMNLLKIDGEWKVVSKIFYKKIHDKKE